MFIFCMKWQLFLRKKETGSVCMDTLSSPGVCCFWEMLCLHPGLTDTWAISLSVSHMAL